MRPAPPDPEPEPASFRAAADRACYRADVILEHWQFDGDTLQVSVRCERGQKALGATRLRGRFSPDSFEAFLYRSVVDWTE